MKAIGAKSVFILSLFMSEALFIGLIGSTLGILMGIMGAYIMTGFAPGIAGGEEQVQLTFLLYSYQVIFLMSGFFQ
jgi:ABC-type lipoprotein release transport system permease subunit